MQDYSETTIRAQIKTVIESVSDHGVVYDYQRWSDDWNTLLGLFGVTISGQKQIRGWMISLENVAQVVESFMGGGDDETILVTYQYLVMGFLGVDDSTASEKTMAALALAITKALTTDATLKAYVLETESPPVRINTLSYRMFAGILSHYVEMRITLQEVL